jgi:hypothetical protein
MKSCGILLFIVILIIHSDASSQSINSKVGGICFRVDDNQTIPQWEDYAKVFSLYGYNFTFAMNPAIFENPSNYSNLIDKLQQAGHEFLDHTPNHDIRYFTTDRPDYYKQKKGVHHIIGDKIDLAYDSIDTTGYMEGDGIVEIRNNMIISKVAGGFKNTVIGNSIYAGVWLPALQKFFSISQVLNFDASDVDTLIVKEFWGEDVSINNASNTPLKFIGADKVRMNTDGLSLLAERTLEISQKLGIKRPYTWIQPGGEYPMISAHEAKIAFGDKFKYRSAAVYPNPSDKVYGEENSNDERRYAMQWGDFLEDATDFHSLRSVIADKIAKHYVLIGHSHFLNLMGGWNGYLNRMDSLLSWCRANHDLIQIKTYDEWATQLYETPQNPYANIIPPLNIDLDHNSIPDGYFGKAGYTDGTLDLNDGMPASGGASYTLKKTGNIFTISRLAGLEKGENDLFIWSKGAVGDSIGVTFYFPGTAYQPVVFKFPATTSEWTKYGLLQSMSGKTTLTIPKDVVFVDIYVNCFRYSSGTIKVSGLELRKKITEPLKIISQAPIIFRNNDDYQYALKVYSDWPKDTLSYSLKSAPSWLSITHEGVISGRTPLQAGSYPVSCLISDQHNNVDSQYFSISVENRRILTMNTSNLVLGNIPLNSKKDTVFTLTNDGLDTASIHSVTTGSYLSVLPINPKIPPKQSVNVRVKLFADIFGVINSYILISSDAENIVDSIKVTANSGIILDTQRTMISIDQFSLYQNFPNPFNAGTVITYTIKYESMVSVIIYNVLGQAIKTLLPSVNQTVGKFHVQWTGDDDKGSYLGSGVYFCRMTAIPKDGSARKESIKKMILLR